MSAKSSHISKKRQRDFELRILIAKQSHEVFKMAVEAGKFSVFKQRIKSLFFKQRIKKAGQKLLELFERFL